MIKNTHTYTTTHVRCPDCGHRLELARDAEDESVYYTCGGCGVEWTLEGKKKVPSE